MSPRAADGGAPRSATRPRAIAYLRVSTDRQAVDGLGLEVQAAAVRAWCRQHGRRLVHTCTDAGISGAVDVDARPALAEAIRYLGHCPGAELVVYRLDRLARDLILQEQLLAEVARAGGVVRSTFPGEDANLADDPADPSRALIRQVLGAVAQHERALIRLRMAAGVARKREAGGYAGGRPPFGARAVRGALEPDPVSAPIRDRIRRLSRRGLSLREIAQALESGDVPAPGGGSRWHPATVARILRQAKPQNGP